MWVSIIESYIIPNAYVSMFDYAIGNPPWLSYRYIADPDYQENVIKPLMKDYYNLTTSDELITHMEMATLFFVRSIDMYLKDGGKIGFVMPRSIFNADQHHNFRAGYVSRVNFTIRKVMDLDGVEPLFYVPACAIIAEKDGKTQYPIPAIRISGKLPQDRYKTMPLTEVSKMLTFEDRQLYLDTLGKRSTWDYKSMEYRASSRSYYYDKFKEGAAVVPRPLFFVDIKDVTGDTVIVKSAKRVVERKEG
ncbi:MAG: Eco57I restriction-modification methylase domain-containing protein [Infirmifilum sp.]